MLHDWLEKRRARLAKCCCPIHGTGMGQVDNLRTADDKHMFVAGCPRKGCKIRGTTPTPHGALTLLPEWAHLVDATPPEPMLKLKTWLGGESEVEVGVEHLDDTPFVTLTVTVFDHGVRGDSAYAYLSRTRATELAAALRIAARAAKEG